VGYKILYTKFLLSFDRGFRGCDILGGKLILNLSVSIYRTSKRRSHSFAQCPVFPHGRQVSGVALAFHAVSMSIRTGLPGDGFEWVNHGGGAARTGQDIARGRFMDGVGG